MTIDHEKLRAAFDAGSAHSDSIWNSDFGDEIQTAADAFAAFLSALPEQAPAEPVADGHSPAVQKAMARYHAKVAELAAPQAPAEAREVRWNKTTDGLPKKPGLKSYEQIECLIMLPNGDIEISMWNCEHEVWDDAEGDDYRHDPDKPTHWLALQPIRAALAKPIAPGEGEVG